MNKQYTQILLLSLLILITSLMRVVNAEMHIYNLVPIAAMGIFSGSVLRNQYAAYLIPLGAMLLSDIGLSLFTNTPGFYGISQFVTYAALGLVTFMGTFLVKRNLLNVTGVTLSGSVVFFILSNFGTFLGGFYGYSFAGFINCYEMALPFYKSEIANTFFLNSFAGDLCFSFIAFGSYYLAMNRISILKVAK